MKFAAIAVRSCLVCVIAVSVCSVCNLLSHVLCGSNTHAKGSTGAHPMSEGFWRCPDMYICIHLMFKLVTCVIVAISEWKSSSDKCRTVIDCACQGFTRHYHLACHRVNRILWEVNTEHLDETLCDILYAKLLLRAETPHTQKNNSRLLHVILKYIEHTVSKQHTS